MSGDTMATNAEVEETAARFALLRGEGPLSAMQRRALEAWLGRSPAHGEALEQASAALEALDRLAGAPEILEARAEALQALQAGPPRHGRADRPWRTAALVAVAAGLVCAGLVFRQPLGALLRAAPATYTTGPGERATVSLPDGSVATLDSRSEMRVDYRPYERGVRLLRGQALFEVAKNRPAPFRVRAGGETITAVGTEFNVRLDGPLLRLSLVEGRVKVTPSGRGRAGGPVAETFVSAGEVMRAGGGRPETIVQADASLDTSWRSGVLVFRDDSLNAALAEMSRYAAAPMRVDGAAGERLHVTGAFQTTDPEGFARTMTEIFPLRLEHGPDGGVVLKPKGA